jgi:Effector protein
MRKSPRPLPSFAATRALARRPIHAATIDWNTDQGLQLNRDGVPTGVGDRTKAWLALAHEMIHASRITRGTYTGGTGDRNNPSSPAGKEELQAVGLNGKTPSENSIRAEHDEPLRTAYAAQARPESDEDDSGQGGLTFRVSAGDSR